MEANANPSGQVWYDQSASSQRLNEQQNSTQTVAAGQETKANAQEHYYTITVIQPTMNQGMHQEKFWFNRQGLP